MLNVFPDLLSFGLIGPFLLRVVLGLVLLDLGYLNFKDERRRWAQILELVHLRPGEFYAKALGTIQIVVGIALIVGIYTQVAALIFSIISLAEIWIEYREPALLKRNIVFYILMFAISFSLLFTGAG